MPTISTTAVSSIIGASEEELGSSLAESGDEELYDSVVDSKITFIAYDNASITESSTTTDATFSTVASKTTSTTSSTTTDVGDLED